MLEAAAGIGLKAITFRRLGFDVQGMDIGAVGIELARQLADQVGIKVEFHVAAWNKTPEEFAGRFDAVFIDQALNVRTREALLEAAVCAYLALRPGGIFLFGAMPAEEWDMAVNQRLQRRWASDAPSRITWSKDSNAGRNVTMTVRQPYPRGVYHTFLHLDETAGIQSLETSGFFENLGWSWADVAAILHSAGFSRVFRHPTNAGYANGIALR